MIPLDFHDDLGKFLLESGMDLGQEKTASALQDVPFKERAELLDRDFALILVDQEGDEHRKFACYDPTMAEVSAKYLVRHAALLPEVAVKIAAGNLMLVLGEDYGSLSKLAEWEGGPFGRQVDERRVFAPAVSPPEPELTKVSSYTKVANAARDWDGTDHWQRRNIAVELVKEADATGAPCPWKIRQYAGEGLNPKFASLCRHRMNYTADEETLDNYDRLSKMAGVMETEDVLEALCLIDEQAQVIYKYSSALPHPVLCVYGQEKQAEWGWSEGDSHVTEHQLLELSGATKLYDMLGDVFTKDLCDRFRTSPVSVFKGLPDSHKRILARMATQSAGHSEGGGPA